MTTVCSEHSNASAAWVCNICHASLCPDCAELRHVRVGLKVVICVPCGGPARPLTRPKKIAPYWESFRTFLANMLSREAILQLVAVGGMIYLTGLLPGRVGLMCSTFIFVSYFFHVINRAAHGEETLPLPADFLGLESFAVIGRYGFASLLVWGPAAFYALWGVGWWELSNNTAHVLLERLVQPTVFVLLGLGMLYYPAALIAGAIANSMLAMINPVITFRLIARIPGQYLVTVAVVTVLSIGGLFWDLLVDAVVELTPVAILPTLAGTIVKLPPELLTAFILGRLIFQNAEHFGVVRPEFLVEPVMPNAVPRGQRERTGRANHYP